jgi:sugar lactone lactonase YvrE
MSERGNFGRCDFRYPKPLPLRNIHRGLTGGMKFAKAGIVAAVLLGVIAGAAAAQMNPSSYPSPTIFVDNSYYVTAYPVGGGDAPVVVPTNMANPSSIARDASGRIYVTNSTTNTVTIYPANANGNVPPIAVIGGSDTELSSPSAIALDASGKIYVVNSALLVEGNIAVYPPLGTSTGILNEAPIADITGSSTQFSFPSGIALDSNGNIFVANNEGGPGFQGSITEYPAGATGNVAPIATITGSATGLAGPLGIALDSAGNIYVANQYVAGSSSPDNDSSITVYSAGSNGDAAPIATIGGRNTGLENLNGIAVDSSRNLYVTAATNDVGPKINVYPAGSDGNVSPDAVITGASSQLEGPGIAVDSAGRIYVSNLRGGTDQLGSIVVYPPGSSGDAVPVATITSNLTGLSGASGLALDSVGNIYVANGSDVSGEGGSIAIYPAGSYADGPAMATIAGEDTKLDDPFGIALDPRGDVFALNSKKAVTVYPAGSVGNATPSARIEIGSSAHGRPTGIAVDRRGDLYVANYPSTKCFRESCYETSPGNVTVYSAGSDGAAKPEAVISGPDTKLNTPSAIAVDSSRNIYVVDDGPLKCTTCGCFPTRRASVSVYAPDSKGNATPISTIQGVNTGFGWPYGIAVDPSGNVYVLNGPRFAFRRSPDGVCSGVGASLGDPILIFAAGSHGNVAPIGSIGGSSSGLNLFPSGIAIGPGGP